MPTMKPMTLDIEPDGIELHIGIVRARFNEPIGLAALQAVKDELTALGVAEEHVLVTSVPGALELGVVLQRMATTRRFDALIALGAVVRGDTYHFEVVSNESAAAMARLAQIADMPIINGVLTTDTEEQALERAAQKGRDCARAAVEMANLLTVIDLLDAEQPGDPEDLFEGTMDSYKSVERH